MELKNLQGTWISKALYSTKRVGLRNPILASIIFFGIPVDILVITFICIRFAEIPKRFLIPYMLCVLWLNFGPFFIGYYEQKLMPNFYIKLRDLLTEQETDRLAQKYQKLFSQKYWILFIPWIALIVIIVYRNGFILDVAGTSGYKDVWTWLLSLPILWIAYLAGVGTWGVTTTILSINEISDMRLKIEPLHVDKRGGLGCVGYYAIGTTLLISTGSFFLPMGFQFVLNQNSSKYDVFFAVAFYSAFILLSFLYPTFRIQKGAKICRDKSLELLRKKYRELENDLFVGKTKKYSELGTYLWKMTIKDEYNDMRNLKLYPFEIDTITKLVTSVLLPIFMAFFQKIISQ